MEELNFFLIFIVIFESIGGYFLLRHKNKNQNELSKLSQELTKYENRYANVISIDNAIEESVLQRNKLLIEIEELKKKLHR